VNVGGNTREQGRSSSSRLLALLAAFSSAEPVMTLTRLAERGGLPVATTHRLARELADWGALERLPDGRYQIGVRLWHTGALAPGHRDLRSLALPFMEDLYEATHEVVQLAVRNGRQALVMEKIAGWRSVPSRTVVAGPLPLHTTGVGKVILAFSGPELLAEVVEAGLTRPTPHSITLPGVLADALRQVRETHLGYSREEMTLGACSVAAPVFGPGGELRASLAVVVRSSTDLGPLSVAVRTAALGVGRALSADAAAHVPPGGNRR
jgi:DNA-binding IclR family transcriptional regulator